MAFLITTVSRALGGKSKVEDFILSNKDAKKVAKKIDMISPEEVANVFRSML